MLDNTAQTNFIFYPISLIAAIFVGFDVAIVSYLFTYTTVGILGGLIIATSGFLLNAYVYHEDGPSAIKDLLQAESNWWSRIIDVISILGGLLILLFTLYAYQALALQYVFLQMWFTPLFVGTMACAYLIATFALNKSALLRLLNECGENKGFLEQSWAWINQFKTSFVVHNWEQGFGHFAAHVIVPIFVASVVTYAYTSVFTLGALALVASWHYVLFWQSLVWLSSASFFVGELYFNCEQNLNFMESCNKLLGKQSVYVLGLALVIFANAVANAFIALDAPVIALLTIWGGLRFFCGGVQSFCTMSARCILEFKGWDKLYGGEPLRLAWWTTLVLDLFTMVYLSQVPYILPFYQDPMTFCVFIMILLLCTSLYPPLKYDEVGDDTTQYQLPEKEGTLDDATTKTPLLNNNLSSGQIPRDNREISSCEPLPKGSNLNDCQRENPAERDMELRSIKPVTFCKSLSRSAVVESPQTLGVYIPPKTESVFENSNQTFTWGVYIPPKTESVFEKYKIPESVFENSKIFPRKKNRFNANNANKAALALKANSASVHYSGHF